MKTMLLRSVTDFVLAWWHLRGDRERLIEFTRMRNVAIHARYGLEIMKASGHIATPEHLIARREIGNRSLTLAQRLGFLEGWYQ